MKITTDSLAITDCSQVYIFDKGDLFNDKN